MKVHPTTLLLLFLLSILPQNAISNEKQSAENFGSVEERRINSLIIQERANIRKEREEIAMRKKELKSLEEGVDKKLSEIDNKINKLRILQDKIESLLKSKSIKEKKRVEELASIYQKMSPPKAAQAIIGLDQQLAVDLLANMKVKSAAKILDQISRQKATELSITFSTIQIE